MSDAGAGYQYSEGPFVCLVILIVRLKLRTVSGGFPAFLQGSADAPAWGRPGTSRRLFCSGPGIAPPGGQRGILQTEAAGSLAPGAETGTVLVWLPWWRELSPGHPP